MSQQNNVIVGQGDFSEWKTLNDTIMGGSSLSSCTSTKQGLLLEGNLIEKDGGFISCRSPIYRPPLDLSNYNGLQIKLKGNGRNLKLGITCETSKFRLENLIFGRLRWVSSFQTKAAGISTIDIPFNSLQPAVRNKPINLPVRFKPSCINQFQLLYSKFGLPGKMNPTFKPGSIRITLISINGY